ncbi:MAG: UvrD-helicase domain-containing protein [Clostridia bacterium]|nr:UvrD-helicase domain-containing protein [Clostridia bacterium]
MAEEKITWTPEQEEAIRAIKTNALVSASAGSGKTALMMEKVARLVTNEEIDGLKEPVAIKSMMIVTFTKAVARELRTKVVKKLTEQIHLHPEKAEVLRNQIEDVAIASISTIDSLCSTLVRTYFQKAEVDPAFAVMEQEEADLYFNRAMSKVLAQLDLEQNEGYIDVKRLLGKDLNDDIKAGYAFARNNKNYIDYLNNDALKSYEDFENSKLIKDAIKETTEKAKYLLEIVNDCYLEINKIEKEKDRENAFNCYLALIPKLEQIAKATTLNDLASLGTLDVNFKSFSSKQGDIVYSEVQSIATKAAKEVKDIISTFAGDVAEVSKKIEEDKTLLKEFVDILIKIDAEYVRAKQEDNKLDFNDLEQKTALLLDDADIRAELQDKYQFVCVDEYQDINPLQEDILRNISKGDNLFMVGDVKQSIYGFRLSDPTIFLNKYKKYKNKEKGEAIDLNMNFRSKEEILDFVNYVFDATMDMSFGGIDYKNDAHLVPSDKNKSKDVERVKITFVPKEEKEDSATLPDDKVYSVKEHIFADSNIQYKRESLLIANKIKSLVGKRVLANGNPIEYKDIALLFRTRSKDVARIVADLQQLGIPVDSANATQSTKNTAISLLISLLAIIDNDQQDVELVNILLSIFGGFTMPELTKIREALGDSDRPFYEAFNSYEATDDIANKIRAFKDLIYKYRFKSHFMPVDKLLEQIIEDNNYDEYVLAQESGENTLAQLMTFINALATKSYNASISKFLSVYREYNSIESVADNSITSENCVKTSTVHGSKGLEYPIVFLIDSAHDENSQSSRSKILFNKDYGFAINHFNKQESFSEGTIITTLLKERKQFSEREEALRGLYVALTRPQEYLFITGTETPKKDTPLFADYGQGPSDASQAKNYYTLLQIASTKLSGFKSKYYEEWDETANSASDNKNDSVLFNPDEMELDDEILGKLNEAIVDDYKYKESTTSPIWYSVTQINKNNTQELNEEDDEPLVVEYDFEKFFGEKEKTTPGAGTAYHKVLELIDYQSAYTLADVEGQIEEMFFRGDLTQEQKDMIVPQNVFDCVNSDLMKKARGTKCYREQPFKLFVKANEVLTNTTIEDKILVQGTFDLFIPRSDTNKEGTLIDYKYSSEDAQTIRNTYKKQLNLYKRAIENCMGERVDKMYIYVIGQNISIEI